MDVHSKVKFVQQIVEFDINYHSAMSNVYIFIYFKDLFARKTVSY